MNIICLDLETYFNSKSGYTLRKMTTEAYCRDPQFKMHLFGYWNPATMPQGPVHCLPGMLETNEQLRHTIEISAVMCFHAHFDLLALNHWYGLKPAFVIDPLPMARLVLPRLKSHSLENLAAYFGIGLKTVPYNEFDGLETLPPALHQRLGEGCIQDVRLMYDIYTRLRPYVPDEEMQGISTTVEMFARPVLELDRPRMETFLKAEKVRKAKAMLEAGAAMGLPFNPLQGWTDPSVPRLLQAHLQQIETELQSSAKFKIALEGIGYECPMKWSDKAREECSECNFGVSKEKGSMPFVSPCQFCNGTGKTKGGWIPAIAKSDEPMKELLEHDDSRVQALAAARLGVKSTIDETRASRLLESDSRGALPVYLSYAAAKTLRFGGGDKTNWQNFRRGGEIRKSIVAPEGHKLVIGDLSQIEYRLLCWLTGQTDKLDALKAGRDLYSELAGQFYGYAVSKETPKERGLGKQITLSCLAEGTLTITNHGVKKIETVTEQDLLWDGEEWVTHSGLVKRGLRSVMSVGGLWLTPDHRVLCGSQWQEASSLRSASTLFQALEIGAKNLPSQATRSVSAAVSYLSSCDARAAAPNTLSTRTTSLMEKALAAMLVRKRSLDTGLSDGTATLMSCLKRSTVFDSWGELLLAYLDATRRRIADTSTMVLAAFESLPRGELIARLFLPTFGLSPAGMSPPWSWTERTSTAATNQGICASSRAAPTCKTVVAWWIRKIASRASSRRSMTYDLALAGPRSRFTVVTAAGPLIVHNCGYGAGGDSIKATAKNGTYGPPLQLTDAEALKARDLYRATHPMVVGFWKWCSDHALPALQQGHTTTWWAPDRSQVVLAIEDHKIWLPNDTAIEYEGLRWARASEIYPGQDDAGEGPSWWEPSRKGYTRTWGSHVTADVTQGLAVVVIKWIMNKMKRRGWRTVLQCHDELVFCVPDDQVEACKAALYEEMTTPPPFCADIPLACEIIHSQEYSK